MTLVTESGGGEAMSKPYWSGPGRGGGSRLADDPPPPPAYQYDPFEPPTEKFGRFGFSPDYPDYSGYPDDDHEAYEVYRDTRWRWIAGVAGVVLLVALVAIAFASHGGDTATRSATPTPTSPEAAPGQDAVSTTPRTVIATVPPSAPAPTAALPPETVVTVTTTPSAHDAPPAAPPPPPQGTPPEQTITYTVTGTRQLFDLVSIIYTDEQGFPRTDVNVALPWTRTVVLNPGVVTKSVTATSLTGQLNCTVTDGSGATLVAQASNAAIASCTQ